MSTGSAGLASTSSSVPPPDWLAALLASPPPSTAVRQFKIFNETSARLVARQHESSLLVLHLAPTHAAFATEGVTVSRVEFQPIATPKEVLGKQRRHAKHAHKRAATSSLGGGGGGRGGGDDGGDDDDDDDEHAKDAVMHLCTLHMSDGATHAVQFRLFGDVRDTNPLLVDGSLQLTAANCLGDGYLALILPTVRSTRALAINGLAGWSAT